METAATKPAAAAHDTDESSSSSSSQQHSLPTSEIVDFYRNKSVFITGATGFLGKVLIEKLLRTCHDLNKIYVLVRSKKGHSAAQRLNEMLNCPVGSTPSWLFLGKIETFGAHCSSRSLSF